MLNNEDIILEERSLKFLNEQGIENDTILKIDAPTRKILSVLINKVLDLSSNHNKTKRKEKKTNENKVLKDEDVKEDLKNDLNNQSEIQSEIIFTDNCKYKALGVSQTKLLKTKEKISYLTICSSVATSGKVTELKDENLSLDDDYEEKAGVLFGAFDDAQNFGKLIMGFGNYYVSYLVLRRKSY